MWNKNKNKKQKSFTLSTSFESSPNSERNYYVSDNLWFLDKKFLCCLYDTCNELDVNSYEIEIGIIRKDGLIISAGNLKIGYNTLAALFEKGLSKAVTQNV